MTRLIPAEENRRQAVRIDDRILLAATPMSVAEFDSLAIKFTNGISLYNQDIVGEVALYLGAQSSLGKIREQNEDLADFLQHLDSKINRILDAVSGKPSPLTALAPQEVNISGKGLAFPYAGTPAKGDYFGLQIVLLPEQVHVYAVGRVVSVDKCSNALLPCRVACEFVLLMDQDRELIIQHIFKHQHLALRNQRQSPKQQ